MRNKNMIRVTAILVLILFCITLPLSSLRAEAASTNSKIQGLEDKLDKLADEKKDLEKNLKDAKGQKSDALTQKKNLDGQIDNLQNQINVTNSLINELITQATSKEEEVNALQRQINEKMDLFKGRMRASYEEGPISLLQILFSAEDFSSMLSQLDIVEEILNYDKNLIQSLEQDKKNVEQVRNEILNNKAEQEKVKASLNEKEAALSDKVSESDKLISSINANMSNYEKELREIDAEEERLEKELQKQLAALNNSQYVGGEFGWPLPAKYTSISSPYGMRYHPVLQKNKLHTGIDLPAPRGTQIYASNAGTVITSVMNSAYGNYVLIDHGGGKATLYAHMDQRLVSKGDKVTKGQVIGKVGSTGWSTGNHLHFEVRINGATVNPMNYFTKA